MRFYCCGLRIWGSQVARRSCSMPCSILVEVGPELCPWVISLTGSDVVPLLVSGATWYLPWSYLGFAIALQNAAIDLAFVRPCMVCTSALTRGGVQRKPSWPIWYTPERSGGAEVGHIFHADWVGGPASQLNCRMALTPTPFSTPSPFYFSAGKIPQ